MNLQKEINDLEGVRSMLVGMGTTITADQHTLLRRVVTNAEVALEMAEKRIAELEAKLYCQKP